MADEQLFEDLPEQERPQAEVRGALRLRVPERSQIGMQVAALDDLISEDHPVRSVGRSSRGWTYRRCTTSSRRARASPEIRQQRRS
jgi:hypothetical protein